jgi:hypothetical protein
MSLQKKRFHTHRPCSESNMMLSSLLEQLRKPSGELAAARRYLSLALAKSCPRPRDALSLPAFAAHLQERKARKTRNERQNAPAATPNRSTL